MCAPIFARLGPEALRLIEIAACGPLCVSRKLAICFPRASLKRTSLVNALGFGHKCLKTRLERAMGFEPTTPTWQGRRVASVHYSIR
jgi:hypothetical protein